MVDRRPSGQAANGKDTVISLQELLSSNAANHVLQATAGRARIADSSSIKALTLNQRIPRLSAGRRDRTSSGSS
jgi:hypothetical protein